MIEHKKLIVVPQLLRQLLMEDAHDLSGHLGMDWTLTRLIQTAYWDYPMGDSLVERMDRTLLNVLHFYVEHTGLGRTSPAPFVCLPHNQALFHRPVSS